MTYEMVNLGIVIISGFSQKVSGRTGMGEMYCKLRRAYATTPDRYIMHRPWNADFSEVAHIIDRDRTDDFRLCVCAYSWGCGNGVLKFAKELGKLGLGIDLLLLIDPVLKRPGFWFSPRQAWALTRWGKFKVPANVAAVQTWRQVNGAPYGRKILLLSERTQIIGQGVFGSSAKLRKYANGSRVPRDLFFDDKISHNDMDDDGRIHQASVNRIRDFVSGRPLI